MEWNFYKVEALGKTLIVKAYDLKNAQNKLQRVAQKEGVYLGYEHSNVEIVSCDFLKLNEREYFSAEKGSVV